MNQEGTMTATLSTKSGEGISDGVVSELTAFFGIKPGHEEQLRAACERFADNLRAVGPANTQRTGLRDWKHVFFDNDRRLMLITTLETDWDPYIDSAVALIGIDHWIDWMQHTVEAESLKASLRSADGAELPGTVSRAELEQAALAGSPGLKQILQAAQVPAVSYFNALADQTVPQVRKAQRVEQAFQQVLDGPAAEQALRHPALQPLH